MIKSLMLTTLALLTLGYGTDPLALPDRCADPDEGGYPLYCTPTGPGAPVWGESVCCAESDCVEIGALGCPTNTREYTCDLATVDAYGKVTCLFEVPDYCQVVGCPSGAPPAPPGYQPQPAANVICCFQEGCYDPEGMVCNGWLFWCDDGVTNMDGTVTCFDDDAP